MREAMQADSLNLTAAMAKERSQAVVQRETDQLMIKVMTEIDKATTKGSFRIAVEMAAVPANVCRQAVKVLKDKGFVTDVSGAVLRVSWGGMDNE